MKSLRTRFFIHFFATILVVWLLIILGVNLFVEDAYYRQKINHMDNVYKKIANAYKLSNSTAQAIFEIDHLAYSFEGKITVIDSFSEMIIYRNNRYEYKMGQFIKELTHDGKKAYIYNTDYPIKNTNWLIYIGGLDDTKIVLLEIPLSAIDDTIDVFRTFLNKIMIISLFIVPFLAFYLSNSVSRPILELNILYSKLGDLKFDIPYKGNRKDEIGQLGNTFNQIKDILKSTIDSLTKELNNKQKLDLSRKRFVAQVSHELQTPISIISTHIEALKDGMVADHEIQKYYDIIEKESYLMSRTVQDLLNLSSLESGQIKYQNNVISLDSFLRELIDKNQPIARSYNKEITYTKTDKQLEYLVFQDNFRLRQALANLLSNAIKFANQRITIKLENFTSTYRLSIMNDGQFIAQEDLENIWESFYKSTEFVDRKNGTGLGLAIAGQIFQNQNISYRAYNDYKHNLVVFELIFLPHKKTSDELI